MGVCHRCGKERELESLEVDKCVYRLCPRCTEVFHRRFDLFMAGG